MFDFYSLKTTLDTLSGSTEFFTKNFIRRQAGKYIIETILF